MDTSRNVPDSPLSSIVLPRPLALVLGAMTAAMVTALPPACAQISNAAVFSDGVHSYARHRILLESAAGLSDDDLGAIVGQLGGKARKLGQSRLRVVDLSAGVSEQAVVDRLRGHPALRFAELDLLVPATLAVTDPYIGSEWHIAKIGAPAAWDTTQGAGVTIAILDSGVEATHPDLKPNLVAGYNLYDGNTDTSDVCAHGTEVAGAAAARGNNGIGVAGVAGQAKIMPVRIAFADIYGRCWAYASTVADGITYAADHGARIANASYGNLLNSAAVLSAGEYMKSKGGLVFISAGNNGIDEHFIPSTSVITVSATETNDAIATWSSYGDFVVLSAPGANILSTTPGGNYGGVYGTSFASPITAAVAALMMSAAPTLDSAQIEEALFASAVPLGAPGRDPLYGYGRVDAAAAVKAAIAKVPVTDHTPPTAKITAPAANSSAKGNVTVTIAATDDIGVDRVELAVNGTMLGVDNASPYSIVWNSTGVPNGMSTLVATAFDKAGNATASAPVAVNVANPAPPVVKDKTAPVVKIDNPVAGSVSGAVNVSAQASDNSGAAGITQTLSVDGAAVASGKGATLAYTWQTATAKLGNHKLKVVAKDVAGNSSNVTVTVKVVR